MEYIRAFLVGGLICLIGELLICYTKLTPARILVAFVVAGVVLGSLGLWAPVVDFAGAGGTVPLIGFGNLIAEGTHKAIADDGALGILSGGLAGTTAGIGASIFFGTIVALLFKSKAKS